MFTPGRKQERKKKRPFRIPDFVQFVSQLKTEPPNWILDIPPRDRTRLVLIVEIKKAITFDKMWDHDMVMSQIDQQARCAFGTYPEVDVFGAVIAFGDRWTYREYLRRNLGPSRRSERSGATLEQRSPTPSISIPAIDRFFGSRGFARLQEAESDEALFTIRQRLKSLCMAMFK